MKRKTVAVLLSTYNGEKYLAALLESVLSQTATSLCVDIRDDGSTDSTKSVLRRFKEKYPHRIRLMDDRLGNVGVIRSYEILLKRADADYFAFADQDDVWLPNKIMRLCQAMSAIEVESRPSLVYSDLAIVDERLNTLSRSFYRYSWINRDRGLHFEQLMVQNGVVGCSSMINRSLREIVLPFPPECRMHDWWTALCASCFGRTAYVDEALVLYRQHSRNAIGATRLGSISKQTRRSATFESIRQARALLRLGAKMPPKHLRLLTSVHEDKRIRSKFELLRRHIVKSDVLRTVFFYLFEW